MIGFFYDIGINCYAKGIGIASVFNAKAKAWKKGRVAVFSELEKQRKSISKAPAIFHCASLGEYEQAVPIIALFHQKWKEIPIWVSFFSPSGYQNAKIPEYVNHVFYLPHDGLRNANKLVRIVQPQIFVSIKYEIWPQLFNAFKEADIPVVLLSATFRSNQIYFKPWAKFFRKAIAQCTCIGVQNIASKTLILPINSNVKVTGDTRFDRVWENAQTNWEDQKIEKFLNGEKAIVLGSAWMPEVNLLVAALKVWKGELPKIIIAPHNISADFVKSIEEKFENAALYSADKLPKQVLIIDGIGKLKHLYKYASLAVIGGGFSNKLHNILEPLAFGVPVAFGPNHAKFPEASLGIKEGFAFEIEQAQDLAALCTVLSQTPDIQLEIKRWMETQKGAAQKSIGLIENALK